MSNDKGFSDTSANRYSLALFELASESNLLDQIEVNSISFLNLISKNNDFKNLIKDPTLDRGVLTKVINTISENSEVFATDEFIGTSPVTDNRIAISGKTIDGYIEGANVFFDVNFNQRLDAGEYSATTNENGFFEIRVNAEDESCVKARPIIADVPVGANDSTLGKVTKAYQMVLPSVNDAGSNQVVISPFTSLIGEAIFEGMPSTIKKFQKILKS